MFDRPFQRLSANKVLDDKNCASKNGSAKFEVKSNNHGWLDFYFLEVWICLITRSSSDSKMVLRLKILEDRALLASPAKLNVESDKQCRLDFIFSKVSALVLSSCTFNSEVASLYYLFIVNSCTALDFLIGQLRHCSRQKMRTRLNNDYSENTKFLSCLPFR